MVAIAPRIIYRVTILLPPSYPVWPNRRETRTRLLLIMGCMSGFLSCKAHDIRSHSVTMRFVKDKPAAFSRRKFSSVVRKAIISYYTQEEKQEISKAAKRQQVSLSSFIASAVLREARRVNRSK